MTTETADDRLLDQLFAAVGPAVTAAAASASETPAMTFARVYPSPLHIDVAHYDAAGRVRVFRAPGAPVLAESTAAFLNGGVAELPEAQRRAALALVSGGDADLIVLMDIDAGTAGAALMPVRDDLEPELLFVLHRPAMVH